MGSLAIAFLQTTQWSTALSFLYWVYVPMSKPVLGCTWKMHHHLHKDLEDHHKMWLQQIWPHIVLFQLPKYMTNFQQAPLAMPKVPEAKLAPFTPSSRLIPRPISSGASDTSLAPSMASKTSRNKIDFAILRFFKFLQMKFICTSIGPCQPIFNFKY